MLVRRKHASGLLVQGAYTPSLFLDTACVILQYIEIAILLSLMQSKRNAKPCTINIGVKLCFVVGLNQEGQLERVPSKSFNFTYKNTTG